MSRGAELGVEKRVEVPFGMRQLIMSEAPLQLASMEQQIRRQQHVIERWPCCASLYRTQSTSSNENFDGICNFVFDIDNANNNMNKFSARQTVPERQKAIDDECIVSK